MTIAEKRDKLSQYCNSLPDCEGCKCEFTLEDGCWSGSDEHMLDNYERVFRPDNPYWERICDMADRQRAKGMETYGQGLEANAADMLKRIEHLQEELIDGLMYCEWIKDKLTELEGKA